MPEFPPGESKVAIAPITAKPAGMDCEAELFLGPDELTRAASSGRVPFVSTGAAKNVRLPITMPSDEGAYHGYIDVFTEGLRFLAYILTEDVVIATPVALPFTMSITGIAESIDKFATSYWITEITARITNNNSVPVTHSLRCIKCRPGRQDENDVASYQTPRHWLGTAGEPSIIELLVTLNPGQSVTVVSPFYYLGPLITYPYVRGYEYTNEDLFYHSGVKIRYAWRIFDELNNWSPAAYAGSYP